MPPSSMNASVTSDDLAEYDVISDGPRSLESSIADLQNELSEPKPLQAAKDKFETVTLSPDDIQAYVKKALTAKQSSSSEPAVEYNDRKLVRVYVDGVFDGLNAGHGLQLRQAKLSFPSTYLIVGVFSDDLCQAAHPLVERCEIIRHCRWVDEVMPNAPWTLDEKYLRTYNIDYVAVDEGSTVDPACDKARLKGYDALKSISKVIPTRRTMGLTPVAQFTPNTPKVATVPVPRRDPPEGVRSKKHKQQLWDFVAPTPPTQDPPVPEQLEPWTRPQSPDHEPLIAFTD